MECCKQMFVSEILLNYNFVGQNSIESATAFDFAGGCMKYSKVILPQKICSENSMKSSKY